MANNRIGIKCNVCGEYIPFAKSMGQGFYSSPAFSIENLNEFFDKHTYCCEGIDKGKEQGDTEGDFSLEYEFPYTSCVMIEDRNKLQCSECGTRINDEILYYFNSKEDFKYCPCCGRKIENKW